MPDLSVLAKTIGPLVSVVGPIVKRRRRERQAGRTPFPAKSDILEKIFEETYSHICTSSFDEAWWRSFTMKLTQVYIAPDFLKDITVQNWLSIPRNKHDFFNLASGRLLNDERLDSEVRKRLSNSFQEITGESEAKSIKPIIAVLNILLAGYFSSLDKPGFAVLGFIQTDANIKDEQLNEIIVKIDRISDKVSGDVVNRESKESTEFLIKKIDIIKKTRSIYHEENKKKIRLLAERALSGDLVNASLDSRAETIYWAARLNANDVKYMMEVDNNLKWLAEHYPSKSTAIIYALRKEANKEIDESLQILSDLHDADGRTALSLCLRRTKGNDAAIDWYLDQKENESVNFFTGLGWCNLALTYAELENWEEASAILKGKNRLYYNWPELAYVEGILNLALLLPKEFRKETLRLNIFYDFIETIESKNHKSIRKYAYSCFESAKIEFIGIDENRAEAASLCKRWLDLTSKNETLVKSAKASLCAEMESPESALKLVQLADVFGINYDAQKLFEYLEKKKKVKKLTGFEVQAELILAQNIYSPDKLIEFYESEHEALSEYFDEKILSYFRIEALVNNNEFERARRTLDRDKGKHSHEDVLNLSAMIKASAGEDPLDELKELLKTRDSLIDIHNIIRYLKGAKDWKTLTPYMEKLFDRERTKHNLLDLINCYRKDESHTQQDVLNCIDKNDDLVANDFELLSNKAWIFFYLGRFNEAKEVNDELLEKRRSHNDLHLDVNLTIYNGDWENFSYILNREWDNKSSYDSQTLLRLATLSAETDINTDRVLELVKLAVSKEPDNPDILLNSYSLAFQMGKDEEADPQWLSKALSLSNDNGPVWTVDIKQVIEEMAPSHRERAHATEARLNDSSVPLSAAAKLLHVPLNRILLQIPALNAMESDGRLKRIIPIISGNHKYVKVASDWNIGLDYSTILILEYLGVLKRVIAEFDQITIAPAIMTILLYERRQVRFHQPLIVKKADMVRQYIDDRKIKIIESFPPVPEWLVKEVGIETADLLHQCKLGNGFAVIHCPITKIGSYREEVADLKEYSQYALPIKSFINLLFEHGHIEAALLKSAVSYMENHEDVSNTGLNEYDLSRPIYLDNLSITYLQGAKVLETLVHRKLDLSIHRETYEDLMNLTIAGREGQGNTEKIDSIRLTLRDGIKTGKIKILPLNKTEEEIDVENDISDIAPTISQFLSDSGPCHAIAIDDRFYNQHANIIDGKKKLIPIISSIDLIRSLLDCGKITRETWYEILHKYRRGGFAFILQEIDELKYIIPEKVEEENDNLKETLELTIYRQWLSLLKSSNVIKFSSEYNFLHAIQLSSTMYIRSVWEGKQYDNNQARIISDWVWRCVTPKPHEWFYLREHEAETKRLNEATIESICLFLHPLGCEEERYKAFNSWLNDVVIEPYTIANDDLVKLITKQARINIEKWSEVGD